MLGVSVCLLLLAAWLALDLLRTRQQLNAARGGFTAVQDSLQQGDVDAARRHLTAASSSSRKAGELVDGPPFVVFARLPLISGPVQEVRALANAVEVVGVQVLPALLRTDLRVPAWSGRLDPSPFVTAQAPLARAEGDLLRVQAELAKTPGAGIGQITRGRDELERALSRVRGTVTEARVAADVVPVLSGQVRPQRFLVALQNNAESRGTGGLLGAFAVLRVDKGKLQLEFVGQNDLLIDRDQPVVGLGAEYDSRYRRFETTRTWRSANLSPDTPTVGRLLAALWKAQGGAPIDGVALMDPVALADLLVATGPVTLSDGTAISEANAVRVLESEVYARYPDVRGRERNQFLAETAQRVFTALSTRTLNGRAVASQFAKAVGTGHLQLWATDSDVQRRVLSSRIAGALPTEGPFLSVVSNDVGGSKLDYYLHRTIGYRAKSTGVAVDLGAGPQLEEQAEVSVRLDNRAPRTGLPAYVTARPDDPDSPVGQSHTWVSVYLGPRATLLQATLNGRKVAVESQTERGLSVYSLFLRINAGSSSTLVLTVRQPADPDQPLVYRQQPLVRDDVVEVSRQGSPYPVEPLYRSRQGAR